MPNNNIKIPSGLSLDDTLTALAYATSLQEKLFQLKNPQPVEGQQSPQNATGQENEGKQENMAEGGKEEPITQPNTSNKPQTKAQKLPQNGDFETKVLDELSTLKAEVEALMKDEQDEKAEENIETNDNNTGEKE